MNYQQSVDAAEVAQLVQAWGTSPQERHRLTVDHPFLTGNHQRLVSDGRRAEICYVMHQGNPVDGVLLHTKTIYPQGAFRLPTGGIHQGEMVMETLTREIFEETGLTVGEGADEVRIDRWLGLQALQFQHTTLGECTFATYFFLVQMPQNGELNPQDPDEKIGGWQWRPAHELSLVAETLEQVGHVAPEWGDWGRFRALAHRFVGARIAELTPAESH